MRLISRTSTANPDPVSLDDLANHLRIEATEAASAMRYARVGAAELERYADLALFTQTVEAQGEADASGVLYLPVGPASAQTVTVQTADGTPVPHLFAPGLYPVVTLDAAQEGVLSVVYEAGYGDDPTDLPPDLVHAVLDHALRLYDMRGDVDTMAGLAPSTARIAARYRRVRLSA